MQYMNENSKIVFLKLFLLLELLNPTIHVPYSKMIFIPVITLFYLGLVQQLNFRYTT